jgi:restriction system protein
LFWLTKRIYIQAKRWQQTVGRPEIQAFVGALAGQQAAHKGVLITTSDFAESAITYAKSLKQQKIILIGGDKLADLMIQYNIGVSLEHKYEIKRIDSDYFE